MRNSGKFGNIFIALLIAASFAIAGCGGGGGTAAVEEPPMEMPEPTAQEICEGDGGRYNADGSCTSAADVAAEMAEAAALSGAQDAAMAAYTAAMAAVYAAVDPVARDNAHKYAAMAGTANEAAQAATTSADAMTHQTATEEASASAVEAGMTRSLGITKLANAVANKSAIDSATAVGALVPAPYNNAARVGEAMRTLAFEGQEFEVSGVRDGGSSIQTNLRDDAGDLTEVVTITTRHTGTAPRFTVNVDEDADNTNDNSRNLMRGETPSSFMMRGGWMGTELVGENDDGDARERALVFTDIKAPQQQYDEIAATDGTDNPKHYTLAELRGADDVETDTGVLNRAVITGDIPGDGSHFVASLNPNPTDNDPPLSGRFHCNAPPCSISVSGEGILVAIQGYEFRPSLANDITRQDSDYLSWGVWLRIPKRLPAPYADTETDDEIIATARAAADIAAIAYGSDVFDVNAALTGSATYNGVAAGLYAAGGMVEYFDADVSLEANFGGKSADDSTRNSPSDNDNRLLGTVGGSIDNIKAAGMDVEGSILLGNASLLAPGDELDTTPEVDRAFGANSSGNLGGRALTGRWAGRFYGPNKAPAGSVAERTEFPTTAAGTFSLGVSQSNVPHVSIVGAFGAWKAE